LIWLENKDPETQKHTRYFRLIIQLKLSLQEKMEKPYKYKGVKTGGQR
jgi:hypothetical protein